MCTQTTYFLLTLSHSMFSKMMNRNLTTTVGTVFVQQEQHSYNNNYYKPQKMAYIVKL